MRRARLLLSLLVLTGLLAGLMPGLLSAREVAPAQEIPPDDVVARLYFDSRAQLDAVAAQYDIWEVHFDEPAGAERDSGYAVVQLLAGDYTFLLGQGYRLEIDQEKTARLGINAPLDARYYYFDSDYTNPNGLYMVNFLQNTTAAYPDLTELIDIGNAWQGEHGGYNRDLWVLRVTNEDAAYGDIANKPTFVLHANVHAREVTTPEMVIRYIKYLLEGYRGEGGYGVDPDVTWLLDWNVAYLMVSANPDGHRVNEANTSANRRKNMNNISCGTGNYGIDLNRNHNFRWGCCGGSSGDPCSETYRGVSRSSEPETFYFQNYITQNNILRDQNGPNDWNTIPPAAPLTTTGVLLSLHTYQDMVLWPWGFTSNPAPNSAQLIKGGRKLGYYTGYEASDGFIYTVDGDTHDWSYGQLGVASFGFEIGPIYGSCGGFFPAYGCQDGIDGMTRDFWSENQPAYTYLHKIARTPYITAYGPDAQNLTVSPDPVPQGTPLDLSALIQDHRCCGDTPVNAAGAEYFIDEPGADGTGIAMNPQDGSWGGAAETAIATVNTVGLSLGRHYILVHGKSAADNRWGPFTAIFITVGPPAQCDAVQIEEVVTQTAGCSVDYAAVLTGTEPFAYDWDFGAFGSSTEPAPTVAYGLPGTYAYTLTVTNCYTGTATAVGSVTVDCCVPPSSAALEYAPPGPLVGETVVFTGTAESNRPLTYSWTLGDGGVGSGAVVTHTYAADGDYLVEMAAESACGSAVATATVSVCEPVAEADFNWTPLTPTVDQWVAFHGTAAGSTPIAYTWAFGDGGTGSGANTSHKFTTAGLYTVVMTATNCAGHTSVQTYPVPVLPAGGCAMVAILNVTQEVDGCSVALSADLSGDAPFTYLWALGDGATSTLADPTYTYTQTGVYSATLEVANCAGAGHDTYAFTVEVSCAVPTYWYVYLPIVAK